MNAQDLRIGNIVKCKISNDAVFYQIMAIDGYNNKIMLNYPRNNWIDVEKLNPILLTEEILFKCVGFEKIEIMIEPGLFFKIYKQDDAWIISSSNGLLIRKLKYLHEFQNIFKELTGKELEINL